MNLTVDVTGVAHGGSFIARHEGRVIFVRHTDIGEQIVVRPRNNAHEARFWRADLVEVLQPSPHRRAHVWPESQAADFGGVEFGHLEHSRQLELKSRVLREQFSKFAGLHVDTRVQDVGGTDGYRTHGEFFTNDNAQVCVSKFESNELVPVTELPLLVSELQREVFASALAPGQRWRAMLGAEPAVFAGQGGAQRKPLLVQKAVATSIGTLEYTVDARGFWQPHAAAPTTLIDTVLRLCSGSNKPGTVCYDLYAGAGLFSVALSEQDSTRTVISVEAHFGAHRSARENLRNYAHARAVHSDVLRFLQGADQPDILVMDPPRSGAKRRVMEEILRLSPEYIVYVACDPVALARDFNYVQQYYELESLEAFDLFPHTHHFETVALLRRAPTG